MDRFIYVIQDSTTKTFFASARYARADEWSAHATITEHEWTEDADGAFCFSTYDAAQRTLDDLGATRECDKLHIILRVPTAGRPAVALPTNDIAAAKDAYRCDHPRGFDINDEENTPSQTVHGVGKVLGHTTGIRKVLGYTVSTPRGTRDYVCVHCAAETTTPLRRTSFPVYDPNDTSPCCVCSPIVPPSYADDAAEVR